MGPEYQQILFEVQDRILTLTLNRPDRLNAFTPVMGAEFIDALRRADQDDAVRVVIVTGAGRAFCAGADLARGGSTFDRRESAPGVDLGSYRDGGGLVSLAIFELRKPIIAAVNGPAAGVGATMILPMDIRLASETARFGFVFARRGIVPEACSSWFLPRVVGVSRALEWGMTGRVFPAAEALEAGLVRRVLPPEQLLPAAREIAREIAANTSAVSVALIRQAFWRLLGADHPMAAHRIESKGIFTMGASPDCREGVQSFLAKRAPRFTMTVSRDMPPYFPWWKEPAFEADGG